MPGGHVDHPSAAKAPAHASRHFPRFEQLFPRQTSGVADRTPNPIQQGLVRKAAEIEVGEAVFRGW
jgi:hypothetical protein